MFNSPPSNFPLHDDELFFFFFFFVGFFWLFWFFFFISFLVFHSCLIYQFFFCKNLRPPPKAFFSASPLSSSLCFFETLICGLIKKHCCAFSRLTDLELPLAAIPYFHFLKDHSPFY